MCLAIKHTQKTLNDDVLDMEIMFKFQILWKMICQFLIELNMHSAHDLATLCLSICPSEMKT